MNFLGYFIMIVAAIGMVVGITKQKRGVPWGKPLTVICALVALLFALTNLFTGGTNTKKLQKQYQEWNTAYQLVAGEMIGQYISDKIGNAEVVVLRDNTDAMDTFIEGMRKGFGDNVTIADEITPDFEAAQREMMIASGMDPATMPEEEMAMMMPMDPMMMSPDLIDEALEDALDADVVVSLIGLPYEYLDMDFWRNDGHPKFVAVSISMPMPAPEMKSMIEVGHITAWITNNPEGDHTLGDVPEDLQEAFDKRYIIVDGDNVKSMADKFPNLFMSMQ